MLDADLLLIKYNMAAQHDLGTKVAECRLCCRALSRLSPGPRPALQNNRRKEEEVEEDERRRRKQHNGTGSTEKEEGRGEEETATLLCWAANAVYTINRLLLAVQAKRKKWKIKPILCAYWATKYCMMATLPVVPHTPLPTLPTPAPAVQLPFGRAAV